MNPSKPLFNKTTRIAICYATTLVSVAAGLFFAVGRETLLAYAAESKPYSMLFSGYSQRGSLERNESFKIICFGDSNSFSPPDRTIPRPENFDLHIPGLINEEMKARGFTPEPSFAEWAYAGADMFDYYCLFYKAVKLAPDLIIIPINWRSFSSAWIKNPMFFHPELSAFVPLDTDLPIPYEDPIRAEGITTIKQIEYKIDMLSLYKIGLEKWAAEIRGSVLGKNERDDISSRIFGQPAVLFQRNRRTKKKSSKSEKKKGLQNAYPMTISPANLTLKRMRSLAYIASHHDIKVLFYIWPLNVESLVDRGKLEESEFDDSKEMIVDAIDVESRKNIFFVDLSELLAHEDFYDGAGHFTAEGKKKIAKAIAPRIVEILKSASVADK